MNCRLSSGEFTDFMYIIQPGISTCRFLHYESTVIRDLRHDLATKMLFYLSIIYYSLKSETS